MLKARGVRVKEPKRKRRSLQNLVRKEKVYRILR
jgi:hypothetical protein